MATGIPPSRESEFGYRFKVERQHRQLTIEQVAERCQPRMKPQAISRLERGEVDPKLSTIRRLARAIGVDPAALIAEGKGNL